MRICKYSVPSPWWIKLLMCLLIIMQVACSSAAEKTELADWVELSFLIDGMIEIQLKVPPVKIGKELNKMQFIGTKDESPESLFIASYDPGRGRDRDLLLIRISGVVVHVERENEDGVGLSLEEIKNKIYLSRSNANQDFEFIGDQNFTGRSWLRVNLIGGYRKGVAYSTPIQDEYVLILMMSMYGEKSSKTKLFSHRHETLKEVVKSVRILSIND